jgi:hypothetical protein
VKAEPRPKLARIPIPVQVEGAARFVAARSSAEADFAAADVRRPVVAERLLANRAPLVLASLALLLLVAGSGSFLVLAHRASRAGLSAGS